MKIESKIREVGTSKGMIIPAKVLKYVSWELDDEVLIDEKDGKLVIELKYKKEAQ